MRSIISYSNNCNFYEADVSRGMDGYCRARVRVCVVTDVAAGREREHCRNVERGQRSVTVALRKAELCRCYTYMFAYFVPYAVLYLRLCQSCIMCLWIVFPIITPVNTNNLPDFKIVNNDYFFIKEK